jgi:Immunity protein 10
MMMDEPAMRFTVRRVEVTEDTEDNLFFVGLSENHDNTGRMLIFQLGLSFDDQDVALGMDTYCLTNALGASVYGGVMRCALVDDLLTLQLAPEAAELFNDLDTLLLRLELDGDSVEQLRQGLRRVLSVGPDTPLVMIL